jgi:hypothetical protein
MGTYGTAKRVVAPTGVQPPEAWVFRASCKSDPELFFDEHKNNIKHAKQICAACPVLRQCQAWGLDNERGKSLSFRHGVIGGMTPEERVWKETQSNVTRTNQHVRLVET